MARSLPDRGRRRLSGRARCPQLLSLALIACCAFTPAPGAQLRGDIAINGSNWAVDFRDGSWTLNNITIQASDTRVTAERARGIERTGGVNEMDLTGSVQVEHRGITLQAGSALVVFRGNQLVSVKVSGRQAQFARVDDDASGRVHQGRADAISFESASGKVVFEGNTFFTDGCIRMSDFRLITYDTNSGVVTDDGDPDTRGQAVLCPDSLDRVRTPRTPERGTSQ